MLEKSQALSVGQLTDYIARTLQNEPGLTDITVVGEISNFVHHSSGHMYFTLKDKDGCIKGVMFRTWNKGLPFRPEDGQQVYARGDVVVYKKGGNYQLNVYGMEPAGQGALALAFAQLKDRLAREGLFAQGRKLPLPRFPKRVGLVTSPQGAALQDFLATARQLGWPLTLVLAPAQVQGRGGADSVVAALEGLAEADVDVIVVTRGGGSLEELWVFNEEKVARAVAASPVPVVSAVGHETDFTICDFAAAARAATPTAAARLVVPDLAAVEKLLGQHRLRLARGARGLVEDRRRCLEGLTARPVLRRPLQLLLPPRQNLDHMGYRLHSIYQRRVESRRQHLSILAGRLADLNPLAVLRRGFAVLRDRRDIIKSVKQLYPGQQVVIQLQDGWAQGAINSVGRTEDGGN